jgi:hypothetical protein
MLFDFEAGLSGDRVVDQIVEYRKKLGAGHDAASTIEAIATERISLGKKCFMVVVRPGLILRASIRSMPALWTLLSF